MVNVEELGTTYPTWIGLRVMLTLSVTVMSSGFGVLSRGVIEGWYFSALEMIFSRYFSSFIGSMLILVMLVSSNGLFSSLVM